MLRIFEIKKIVKKNAAQNECEVQMQVFWPITGEWNIKGYLWFDWSNKCIYYFAYLLDASDVRIVNFEDDQTLASMGKKITAMCVALWLQILRRPDLVIFTFIRMVLSSFCFVLYWI